MTSSVPPTEPHGATRLEPPQTGPGGAPRDPLDRFFASLRGSGLFRAEDRWIGGVCAGLAERLRVDPLIVRAAFVLLGLTFGVGVPIYLVAWLLLPDRQGTILLERGLRTGDVGAVVLMIVAIVVVTSGFGWAWGWGGPGPLLPLVVVAGAVWFVLSRNRPATPSPYAGATSTPTAPFPSAGAPSAGARSAGVSTWESATTSAGATPSGTHATTTPAPAPPGLGGPGGPGGGAPTFPAAAPRWQAPPPEPRPRRRTLPGGFTLLVLGLAAIAGAGTTMLTRGTDLGTVADRLGWVAATAVVALGALVAGLLGRRAVAAGAIALVLAAGTAVAAAFPTDVALTGPHGNARWQPTTVASQSYDLSSGTARLDLAALTPQQATGTLTSHVGAGELRIVVPDDLTVRVRAQVGAGQISSGWPGDPWEVDDGGLGRTRAVTVGTGTPTLTVDARVGLGVITIERTTR
ncbi:PspC domain-containing protein [Barrientosiimonas humi]|uniref:PspC domain-containing protein n=1 Tax=Barrientosiimonas humi TaxID=999931 RepID=UPI00370DA13C